MVGTLLDLPNYIKFFLGLFALVNTIGILPVFISGHLEKPKPTRVSHQ
ncbi:hypothetical protein [Arsenophonus sp. ENCA]|nr:hypothetical protein [Arsenophonus sp. ENCA]